jgi:hypothetical protein
VWYAARRREADTGEALQSDVMRFMAILALCLVAVFALVQSLPLHPVEPPPMPQTAPASGQVAPVSPGAEKPALPAAATATTPAPRVADVQPAQVPSVSARPQLPETGAVAWPPLPPPPVSASEATLEQIVQPAPEAKPSRGGVRAQRMPTDPTVTQKAPRRVTVEPLNVLPEPAPDVHTKASEQAEQTGLALRFSSDDALLSLVAQRRVHVYAWGRDSAWLLSSERGALRFAPAEAPKRFHNMTPDTVPRAVVRALTRATPGKMAATATWGVVLPADIGRRLARLTQQHANGTLLIQADGQVRLAASDLGSS